MIVAVIGTGNMGKALAAGFAGGFKGDIKINLYDVYEPSLMAAAKLTGGEAFSDLEGCVKDADYVLMAVKPVNFDDALREVSAYLKPDAVVLSIAAAVTTVFAMIYQKGYHATSMRLLRVEAQSTLRPQMAVQNL